MEAGYARLCMRYGVATALLTGTVGIDDFTLERLNDPARLELGRRVELVIDESIEASALLPQRVQITLKSGATFDVELPTVLGHPDRPLAEAALVEKFEACCRSARVPLEGDQVARLNAACISLAASSDVRGIVELAVA
jgi:2-methylcitrate dehydratase PrpD